MTDLQDFESVYTSHWEKLYAFCFRLTRDEHLSQNIVQDIFTDLWERKETLQVLSIENYLFRAAKNQVLKEYRRKRFDTTVIEEKFEDYFIDHIPVLETELLNKLYVLLDHLPEKRKEILIMSKIEEKGIEQIAAELNISKQTVKNQISSALKQLRFHAEKASGLVIPFGIYILLHLNNTLMIS